MLKVMQLNSFIINVPLLFLLGGIEAYTGSQFATTMDDAFQYTGQPESVQLSRLTINEKNGITSIPFGKII